MGAVVGELVAEAIDQTAFEGIAVSSGDSFVRKTVLTGGQIGALLITELAGGDGTTAVNTATNAILNNYLYPKEKQALIDQLNSCVDQECRTDVQSGYETLSEIRDDEMKNAMAQCGIGNCNDLMAVHWDQRLKYTQEGNKYFASHSNEFAELQPSQSVWHTMKIDPVTGKPTDLIQGSNGNRKFYHPLYGYEVVINTNGSVVTDQINMGTYNLYNPSLGQENANPLIADDWAHGFYDVVPYFLMGNESEDLSTSFDRGLRGLYNTNP